MPAVLSIILEAIWIVDQFRFTKNIFQLVYFIQKGKLLLQGRVGHMHDYKPLNYHYRVVLPNLSA
jgi:hypothetical protein